MAKDDAPVIDITWPPSNPRAYHSGLTVSGEILESLRPFLENGRLKAVIDPKSPFHFNNTIEAFGYLETGRASGKVVISNFPQSYNM
ncbi:zinc-binding dehydrogenase [Acinetobacter baumannii]